MHIMFQLVPVFLVRGCLSARSLQILLKSLFWSGNQLPPSVGQFRGVCNRHVRTSKTFPYSLKSLPLSHRRCFFPQLGIHFCTKREGKAEALPRMLMRKWEFGLYKGKKFRIISAMSLFGITKGVRWDVAKNIQISCYMCSH